MITKTLGRKSVQATAIGIMAFLVAACETTPNSLASDVKVDTAISESANFPAFQTYYVLDVPPGENKVAPPKPFSRVVVEAAVRKQLDARNYQEVTTKDTADMLVAIQFSLKDEVQYKEKITYDRQITSGLGYGGYGAGYGRGYGLGYSGYGGYGRSSYGGGYRNRYTGYSYGYGYRNYYGYTSSIPRKTIVAEDFRKGNMLIDLIDRQSNAVVWEAHATGEGEHEAAKIEAKVNAVVEKLFTQYPHIATSPVNAAP